MEQKLPPHTNSPQFSQWLGTGFLAVGTLLLWFLFSPNAGANWWATFILLPVIALLGLVPIVRPYSLFSANLFKACAFVIATVAIMFLLNLSWSVYWPFMIISPALSLYFMGLRSETDVPLGRAITGSIRWLAFTMLLLGVTFQLYTYDLLTFPQTGLFINWWSFLVGLFGSGILVQAIKLHRETGRSVATLTFYNFSGWVLLTAVLEFMGYNWNHWQALIGLIFITLGATQFLVSRKA